MTIQQLECFAETARTLSFARAAEILNVTQPSVSRQIGSLEKELGVRLFARTTRHVSLTPEGELFFTDVKDILNRMKAAMLHVRHEDAENVQILRIGCCDTNDMDVFRAILERTRQAFPALHPFIQVMQGRRLSQMLQEDQLDLLIGYHEYYYMQKGISFYPLFASRICCVLSRANPLSEKKSIAIEDLMEENIIVCTSGALPSVVAGIQSRTSGMFAYSKHHYCDEISVALSLVRAGYGFCILPDSRPAPVPDLAYVPLEGYDPLPCGIFVKESRKQEELIRSFTALFPVSAKL